MPKTENEQDELAKQIGRELASARDARGMSVMELHRRTGISRTVLQGYEAGRFKPGSGELKRLCEALEYSPNRLLFGREDFGKREPSAEVMDSLETNAARAGILISLLLADERRAVLTIVTRLLEARNGGDKLLQFLSTMEEATGMMSGSPGMHRLAEETMKELAEKRPEWFATDEGEEATLKASGKSKKK